MARPKLTRKRAAKTGAKTGARAGAGAADMATRVMRRMEAVARAAVLIQTADALAPGPPKDRLAARVDRMMARLARTPL